MRSRDPTTRSGPSHSLEERQEQVQQRVELYYRQKGLGRNDLLTNPEVLFQHLALEESVVRALHEASGLDRETAQVLDVGCGGGGSLLRFLELGFPPENLFGLDIDGDRIVEARHKLPQLTFLHDDATAMPFEVGRFDLVLESTMFAIIPDQDVIRSIAAEMLRVTRPGGYLLLIDWRYAKRGHRPLDNRRIVELFRVGSVTDVVCRHRGPLVPPIGRAVSRYVPSAYFFLQALLPPLVGLHSTLLSKRPER